MPKLHGSLTKAGKVKAQTPDVPPQEKKKKVCGRARKRELYNKRFGDDTNTQQQSIDAVL